MNRDDCIARDNAGPLGEMRKRFAIPEGVIYLDGNSLGLLPVGVGPRVADTITRQWGETLIGSWNSHGWFDLPRKVGDRIARLISATPGSVIAGDTITVNLFKLLGAAVKLNPRRKVILSDHGNFPSDLYVAQGLRDLLADGYNLKLVAPEEVMASINTDVAVVMLTEVDYRTGRLHDMDAITRRAHEKGAVVIWDLAHSAGVLAVDLERSKADFAVGCTYKYLNGGPGAPAYLYVRPDLQEKIVPPLAGWWGHAAPFDFETDYRPASGILRNQCGTQPILSMVALDAALDVWDGVDMKLVRVKSMALCGLFIEEVLARCAKHGVRLAGPLALEERGSQVALHCPQGYAVMQAMIAEGVIGDFRAPDLIRFGFAPLYTSFTEAWDAAQMLARILDGRLWDRTEFQERKPVT